MAEIVMRPFANILHKPIVIAHFGVEHSIVPLGDAFLLAWDRLDLLLKALLDEVPLPYARDLIDLHRCEPCEARDQDRRDSRHERQEDRDVRSNWSSMHGPPLTWDHASKKFIRY